MGKVAASGSSGFKGGLSLTAVLLGSAAICLAGVAASFVQPADAQGVSAQGAGTPAQAPAFDIPAQDLGTALTVFADRAGLRLLFPSSLVSGLRSPGLSGSFTQEEALGRLLSGTGLTYQFTSANTVTVVDPSTANGGSALPADGSFMLDTITVQGASLNSTLGEPPAPYAGGQVATGGQLGMLGNRDVLDTPFSQTSYTQRTIQDQQARTVNEVLANDPSIIVTGIGVRNDAEFIRGFQNISTTGTRSLNGLPGMAPIEFPSADFIERVEVLKGPSALLNGSAATGSGAIGGTINLTTRQATDDPITRFTPRYVSRSQLGAHLEVGRRAGVNDEFGMRFNGSLDAGDTPVDPQRAQNGAMALNLDYRGDRVRLAIDAAHQSQEDSPRANFATLRSFPTNQSVIPDAPDSSRSLFPEWEEGRSEGTLGMVRGEVDILDNVTAYAALGAQTVDKRFGVAGPAALLDADGRYNLQPYVQENDYSVLSMLGGVRATATTGPVDHAFSVNLSRADYEDDSGFWSGAVFPAGTIYDPSFPPEPALGAPDQLRNVESTVSSIGFADTLSLYDERIQFTAGLRYQQIETASLNVNTGVATTYDSGRLSPAFGLVVKPLENVSLYANYMEGLQAGSTVGTGFENTGDVFAPFVSTQYEAGVKVDWGAVTTTLAVFQIAQPSVISIPGTDGGLPTQALDGEQRNRGVELTAFGEITPGVRLLGGVTFLDARQTRTANGAFDGERAYGAPKVRAVVGAEWDTPFAEGLTLTGRIAYTGDQTVRNSRPDLVIPSWTQVDLGARYTFDSPWTDQPIVVRFNVDNVFNESYWKGAFSDGFISLSDPRTYRLSTTFTF